MLFISKFNVAKQIVTVLLVNFGRRDNLEGVEVHNPPQSCLPRSLGFLVLVIVIGSALKKLFDLELSSSLASTVKVTISHSTLKLHIANDDEILLAKIDMNQSNTTYLYTNKF